MQRSISVGLILLAGALLAYPALRLFWDFEIDYNEGWNAVHQLRAAAGLPLYGLGVPLVFNNYPPLSFYVVGALGAIAGDPVRAGRVVSLCALFAVSLSCYVAVRGSGASRAHAWISFATCLGLFAWFATDYVAMNDPQLLAHAFLCIGMALYVSRRGSSLALACVPLCFALGLCTKHNVLPLPLLVSAHAAFHGGRALRRVYFGSAALVALGACAALWWLCGSGLARELSAPRLYDAARAWSLTGQTLCALGLPLGVVTLGLVAIREDRRARWLLAYLALSLVLGGMFAGGAGVDVNVFFDVLIALALGTGFVADWVARRAPSSQIPAAFVVLVNLGMLVAAPAQLARLGPSAIAKLDRTERKYHADAAYLRRIDGPALCESILLCLRAGKPVFYDPFNVLQATSTGRLPRDAATRLIEQHALAVIQVSSANRGAVQLSSFANFSRDFLSALDRNYVLDRHDAARDFYLTSAPALAQR